MLRVASRVRGYFQSRRAKYPALAEIAARLAVKTESGLITDATDVAADGTTTQSVFAGNYTVTAKVTKGTPIITVKPNAATPEQTEGAGAVERTYDAIVVGSGISGGSGMGVGA